IPLRSKDSEIELMLQLLSEAYEKKTWHGPNLKQSIRGVSARGAAWRPAPGRHNIWELTLHAAYWKYAVRRRLIGLPQGSFALKGSNFFAMPDPHPDAEWRGARQLLDDEHRKLMATVADPRNSRVVKNQLRMIFG